MVQAVKTMVGQPGMTVVRSSENWADRAAPVIFAIMLLAGGAQVWSDLAAMPPARLHERVFAVGLMFAFWLAGLLLAAARAIWKLFGATTITVDQDELVVTRHVGKDAVMRSAPIRLAAIRDVRVKKVRFQFRGHDYHRWFLEVDLDDGETRRTAKFLDAGEADAFMGRCVR